MNFNWNEIDHFVSPEEFALFLMWIRDQIDHGTAEELDVSLGQQAVVSERHFKHIPSGMTWRLVTPDRPKHGFWPIAK
jgi:hypothetical protein